NTIQGHVYEDVDGNGDLTDKVARSGATVRVYRDGGDQSSSGADDTLVATATTDSTGYYAVATLDPAERYWVAVDSKTISSTTALNGGFNTNSLWAEQTYGPAGSRCDNGLGAT